MTTKSKSTFISFSPSQRVIVQPRHLQEKDTSGRVVKPAVPGKDAQFEANHFETDDKEVIDYLRDAPEFETPRGWWEEGKAPDEPKPTKTEQHKAIVKAATKSDTGALREMIAEERATHDRREIILTAEEAIANIEVPEAEEHGRIGRQDEPAEDEGAVPKVDPAEPAEIQPEVEREKVIKSEKVAEKRGEAADVEAQIEAERPATNAEDTEKAKPKKKSTAKKGTAKKSTASKGAKAGQRTTADAGSEGSASQSTAKENDGDAGDSSR